jgi:DNA-binding PadR family transcriptional regulator
MADIELCAMRDVVLAFARVHILHHAGEEPIFGLGMMEELYRHGYRLTPGTMYPLLHRLHEDGLLSVQTETINGKRRKYYKITRKGRVALESIKPKLTELAGEVLPNGPLVHDRLRKRRAAQRTAT